MAIEKDWFPEIAAIKPPGDLCLFGGFAYVVIFSERTILVLSQMR
jgi:hypothetical protein